MNSKLVFVCLPAIGYWVFRLIEAIWQHEAGTTLVMVNFGWIAEFVASISPLSCILAFYIVWHAWAGLAAKDRVMAAGMVALSFAAGADAWAMFWGGLVRTAALRQ